MIIARAILKKLTILAILAKSGDFDGYLRITFSGINIFKKRFLILNVLFKTNSGRCIKPWFERKKNFTPRGEPSPFLWNSNLTYCWKNSLRTLLKVSIVLYLWIEWVKIARQKILHLESAYCANWGNWIYSAAIKAGLLIFQSKFSST